MKNDIKEIKKIQVKTTFSNISKHYYGIFKTISLDSYIKKVERKFKIKKNREKVIFKSSVSDYLDQICRKQGINCCKENVINNESFINPFYDFNKEEIDIFSKKYSRPYLIKPNITSFMTFNEKQKKRRETILKKNKNKFQIPPIGKNNIYYKFINKHSPSFSFSNFEFHKNYHSSCDLITRNKINHKTIVKRNNSAEKEKLEDFKNNKLKKNIQLKQINDKSKRHKSEIIINENDNVLMNVINVKKIKKKKRSSFYRSVSYDINNINKKNLSCKKIINKNNNTINNNNNINNKNNNNYNNNNNVNNSPTDFFIQKIKFIEKQNKKIMIKPFETKNIHISNNCSSQSISKKNTKANTFISHFNIQNI